MVENTLVCNYAQCRKDLVTRACVTICSHIFCPEHGAELFNSRTSRCPNCSTVFKEQFDVVEMDLKPTEQFKSMVLAGLHPEIVLDITNRAFFFWNYQMRQEALYREASLKTYKEKTSVLTDHVEKLISSHKIEFQKLNRKVECLEKEVDDKTKKLEELVTLVAEKSRLIKKLQSECNTLKHKDVQSYIIPGDDYGMPDYKIEREKEKRGEPRAHPMPFHKYASRNMMPSTSSMHRMDNYKDSREGAKENFKYFNFQPVESTEKHRHRNIFE